MRKLVLCMLFFFGAFQVTQAQFVDNEEEFNFVRFEGGMMFFEKYNLEIDKPASDETQQDDLGVIKPADSWVFRNELTSLEFAVRKYPEARQYYGHIFLPESDEKYSFFGETDTVTFEVSTDIIPENTPIEWIAEAETSSESVFSGEMSFTYSSCESARPVSPPDNYRTAAPIITFRFEGEDCPESPGTLFFLGRLGSNSVPPRFAEGNTYTMEFPPEGMVLNHGDTLGWGFFRYIPDPGTANNIWGHRLRLLIWDETTGIHELNSSDRELPRPNPATEVVTIPLPEDTYGDGMLVVRDVYGVVMYQARIPLGTTSHQIDLSHFASGPYFYTLSGRAGKFTKIQ